MKRIVFEEGALKTIGADCFAETRLEDVTVPRSVVAIKRAAFENCGALAKIIFEEGIQLERLEEDCFRSTGLEEITIPRSVTCIEE